MNDKPNDKTNDRPANLVRWGKQPDLLLYELRSKAVVIKCVDNKLYRGRLEGLSQYQLVIVQASELELIVNKGNVIYVHAAAVEVEP